MEKMATNKTQNKSPVFRPGQLWTTIDDNLTADGEETEDEDDVHKDNNETMKLRREDMSLFGICPAWDQFYLVVCEYCKQVIKPQALQQHIELRHSYHKHISNKQINNSSKVGTNSTNIKIEPMIEIERSSASIANTTITENGSDINVNIERTNKRNNSLVNNSAKSDVKLELNSCIDKSVVVVDNSVDTNCINSIEVIEDNSPENKMNSKLINLLSPNISTTIEPLVPEPTGPGPGIGFTAMVSADSDAVTISVPEISSNDILDDNKDTDLISVSKPAPKKKSYKKSTNHRKLLPCKDRLYDPNKHCGVSIPDSDKPCTRSLTCKTHSLTLRRAVQGRNKNFDELLAEHREEKEAAMRAQGIEIKPTKRAIQRQQQQMKQMQMKSEQNLQLLSDKSNSQTMSRTVVFSDSNSTPNTNTNNLLTFVSSPVCSVIESVSTGTRDSQQTVDKLKQISVSSDGSIYMWSQPTPAAICNFNIRRVDHRSRLLSRGDDLTLAALKATFNSPIFVSKLANNQTKCSSNPSPMSIKSPLRNASQTFSVNKKLCTSIDSDLLDTSSNPSADPYNFADAVTTNNSSYNKPKTTINPSKKRKKSDINCTTINSSLLSNGQLFHTSNAIKTMGNTAKKKCVVKKNVNNSHSASVSATIPLTNTSAGNNAINSTNINCEQLINPSTSLISEVPHRSLNDILSNSIDSSKSDNGSILLNGSLLSSKKNTFSPLSKQSNNDIKDSFKKKIFPAKSFTNNNNNNKFLANNLSPALSLSSALSVNPSSRPIIQKQTLPSSSVNSLSQSQNMSQISQSLQNTAHTIFIKSTKQSFQNQLISAMDSPKLLSKTEDFTI